MIYVDRVPHLYIIILFVTVALILWAFGRNVTGVLVEPFLYEEQASGLQIVFVIFIAVVFLRFMNKEIIWIEKTDKKAVSIYSKILGVILILILYNIEWLIETLGYLFFGC